MCGLWWRGRSILFTENLPRLEWTARVSHQSVRTSILFGRKRAWGDSEYKTCTMCYFCVTNKHIQIRRGYSALLDEYEPWKIWINDVVSSIDKSGVNTFHEEPKNVICCPDISSFQKPVLRIGTCDKLSFDLLLSLPTRLFWQTCIIRKYSFPTRPPGSS